MRTDIAALGREILNRLIIVGSPRTNGRSAHLANMLFETCIEECPDDELALAPVSTLNVAGCTGCDACRGNIAKLVEFGEEALDDDFAPCAIDDDMQEIYELIDAADEITVVSPVYFAGPPSQLKALLDRLQPYYWTNARAEEKRPAVLHVVGEGGDPHGFSALVSIVARHSLLRGSAWKPCSTGWGGSTTTARSRPRLRCARSRTSSQLVTLLWRPRRVQKVTGLRL